MNSLWVPPAEAWGGDDAEEYERGPRPERPPYLDL